jgi:1,4-dihydroxy-2-naphthoyl-CoA hydrolase
MTATGYSHSFTVCLHDIDAAGILFYGHLFRHAHDAYEGFMAAIGFPLHRLLAAGDCPLPLVHAEADYRQPLRHGEKIRVALGVLAIGRTSFTLEYRFLDEGERERARAKTVHVRLGQDRTTGAPLPEELVRALDPWLTGT